MKTPISSSLLLLISFCLLNGLSSSAWAESKQSQNNHPNVLVIITDDQGFGDFGFTGNKIVQTPNMDRLAKESARFDNFIVAAACSPTRSAFMTGRNHMKTGVWGVGPRNVQLSDEVIMPQFFKAAGYKTGYIGKRDGIYTVEKEGHQRGIDESSHVTGYKHKDAKSFTHKGPVQLTGWTVDNDVDLSLDYIKRAGDEPWWVTTAFLLPHLPWIADDKYVAPYRKQGYSEKLSAVFGCITQLDVALGRLLDGLEELGQADNTIVVFFSDNGPSFKGLSEEEIVLRNPRGLQGHKAHIYEHGIRSPLLVRWPGHIPPGEREQFASVEDLLPTLLALTGIDKEKLPKHLPFDGISIANVLLDPKAKEVDREVFMIAISGRGRAGNRRGLVNNPKELTMDEQHLALRGPRFKYHNLPGGKTALYDIDKDPGETTDVSAQYPEVAKDYDQKLAKKYQEIIDSNRAYQRPMIKVGKRQRGHNRLFALWAQRTSPNTRSIGDGIYGFTQANASATYAIDVLQPGKYGLEITGKGLQHVAGWEASVDGKTYEPTKVESDRVTFPPMEISKTGPTEVVIKTTEDGKDTKDPSYLHFINFLPEKS